VALSNYSSDRFWYSLAQVGCGSVMALSAHLAAWVWGLLNADDVGIPDVVTNPIDLWRVTVEQLPNSWRRMTIGGGGLLTIILGLTIVDGVTLGHLNGERSIPPKPKLLASVVGQVTAAGRAQADSQQQPESLEEAIEQFGDQGEEFTKDSAEDGWADNPWDDEKVAGKDKAAVPPEVTVTCVIVGYTVDDRNRIDGLLTAAMHRGRVTYAATITDGVNERLPVDLVQQLRRLVQEKPPIPCPTGERKVFWVRPAATCRIDCRGASKNGELVDPALSES
jgi:hypothetical protein